jgi:predicted metal-dependent phosphoesterase TrpH
VAGFCRSVLGCTVAGARRRTLVHQATTWAVIAAYAILAIQPWSHRRHAMTRPRAIALAVLVASLLAGTWVDRAALASRRAGSRVLAGDFHVHGYPIDGTLPRWELQRQAARRGLDVVGVTNHNQTIAGRLGRTLSSGDVIAIPGQEITTPRFHLIAVGITDTIDWRLPAAHAIAAIHKQGGVAIAAHPTGRSWKTDDQGALRALDGLEAAHPVIDFVETGRAELAAFDARVRVVNPDVAPIGSSDTHFIPDMGMYRTYLIVDERSERGVLDAIRSGRTVASDGNGRLIGDPAMIAIVRAHLAALPPPTSSRPMSAAATAVLLALATLVAIR